MIFKPSSLTLIEQPELNKNKSKKMKNKSRSNRDITLIVLFQCILYTFGMCPYLISNVLNFIFNSTPELVIYQNISTSILFIFHGSTLFIYLTFNRQFSSLF